MALLNAASATYNWNLDLSEIARIWTGGCIIRAAFLADIMRAYRENPDLANLLLDPQIADQSDETVGSAAPSAARSWGIPVPGTSSALDYFDTRQPALPAHPGATRLFRRAHLPAQRSRASSTPSGTATSNPRSRSPCKPSPMRQQSRCRWKLFPMQRPEALDRNDRHASDDDPERCRRRRRTTAVLDLTLPSPFWSHPSTPGRRRKKRSIRSLLRGRPRHRPAAMVIFGVSGDLTSRKLMPALYDLAVGQPLPEGFSVVGVSHRDWSDEEFREKMREAVTANARTPVTEDAWQGFAKGLSYVRGDFADPETYGRLGQRLCEIDAERGTKGNRIFYLATSPTFSCPSSTGSKRPGSPSARRITSSQARVGSASSSKNRSATTSSRPAT